MFKGKTIWITGASSGIGEAIAKDFSTLGANLILSARRKPELERVAASCTGESSRIRILTLDLAHPESFSQKTKEAISFFDGIDILINNGGISQRSLILETNMESIRQIMDVNFFGTVALTKAVLPHMIDRNEGYIVVVSSVMGKIGTKYRSAYAASKHALQGWFDCLRQEMYEHNIDVTLVCPGYVRTNITINALTGDGSSFGKMGEAHTNALSAEEFSNRLIPKLRKRQPEIYIGGKEILTVYLKRWFPGLLNRLLRNVKVT